MEESIRESIGDTSGVSIGEYNTQCLISIGSGKIVTNILSKTSLKSFG